MSTARDSLIELKVGVLIVVCLALLVAFLVVLGGIRSGESSKLEIDFETSGGLKVGAQVKIAGIDAGRVEAVRFLGGEKDPRTGRPIWVRVQLSVVPEMRATLRDDASFFITTAGILGEKYIEIDPGIADAVLPEGIVAGQPPMRLEILAGQVSKALEQVNAILGDNKEGIAQTIKDIQSSVTTAKAALEEGRAFIQTATRALGVFETKGVKLLEVATAAIEEYTPGKGETGNGIRAAVASGRDVLAGVERVVGDGSQLGAIVTETQGAVTDARLLLKNVDGQVKSVGDQVKGVLTTADATLSDGRKEVVATLQKVNEIIADVKHVAGQIRRGEGTVGALLMDREMFDDARELMKDIKRHPWKVLWKE